jgi:hypothetical protein
MREESNMRKLLVVCGIAVGLLVSGCGGMPSERTAYRVARETVQGDPRLPDGAELYPMDEVRIYVLKNAARVDFFYDYLDGGESRTGAYVVWLKRVARRWELDRYAPAPDLAP